MAEWISGPRQMTGAPPVRKYSMLIICTPCAVTGLTRDPTPVTCDPLVPRELGEVRYHGFHALGSHFDVVARGTEGEVTPTA